MDRAHAQCLESKAVLSCPPRLAGIWFWPIGVSWLKVLLSAQIFTGLRRRGNGSRGRPSEGLHPLQYRRSSFKGCKRLGEED